MKSKTRDDKNAPTKKIKKLTLPELQQLTGNGPGGNSGCSNDNACACCCG
jgi:hypothetical protein